MKLFQLKITLASCYIFSMLANDILIHEELDSYRELRVSFGKESNNVLFYQATLLSAIQHDTYIYQLHHIQLPDKFHC